MAGVILASKQQAGMVHNKTSLFLHVVLGTALGENGLRSLAPAQQLGRSSQIPNIKVRPAPSFYSALRMTRF